MDKKALRLHIRCSTGPNGLGYCGKYTAREAYVDCIKTGRCDGVVHELEQFIVLAPYLRTISRITGLHPFSYRVAECYWYGNDLLKQCGSEAYEILLEEFTRQGVPHWLVQELSAHPPKQFFPTHVFQVLHVGVGRASGSVPFSLDSINNCILRPGIVRDITPDAVIVSGASLAITDEKYVLEEAEIRATCDPQLSPRVKQGDWVTIHWGMLATKLTYAQVNKYKQYMSIIMACIRPQSEM